MGSEWKRLCLFFFEDTWGERPRFGELLSQCPHGILWEKLHGFDSHQRHAQPARETFSQESFACAGHHLLLLHCGHDRFQLPVQTPNKPRLEVLREFRVSPPLDMSAQTFSRVKEAPQEQSDEDLEDTSETAEMS